MEKRVYLDNNATTPVDPLVVEAMLPFFNQKYGNPNSLHDFGREVHPYFKEAMDDLYTSFNADDEDDIIVNGCATEGNNTVLKGVYFDLIRSGKRCQIVSTPVEHPSIKNTLEFLKSQGAEIVYLPLSQGGIVDVDILKAHVDPSRTALVSIMWANNETGLVFPMKELASYCQQQGILFHTDAVQAVGKLRVDVQDVPVDFLTFSAHKFHGPKGIGGLYIRKDRQLTPLLHGGEHMGGRRSGTVNIPGIIAMSQALKLATANIEDKISAISSLRDKLEAALVDIGDTFVIGRGAPRTPNTIFVSIKGVEGEAMIWDLNQNGIAASTGSACSSESLQSNPSLSALKVDPSLVHTGIRFSLSRYTTEAQIDYVIEKVKKSVTRLRNVSSSFSG